MRFFELSGGGRGGGGAASEINTCLWDN